MDDERVKFDLSFQDEDAEAVADLMRDLGAGDVHRVEQHGMTGIEILFVGVIAAAALTNMVIRLSRLWKCGVVYDARGARVLAEKNCDLPRGTVLVIAPDGTRSTLHEPSEMSLQGLLAK